MALAYRQTLESDEARKFASLGIYRHNSRVGLQCLLSFAALILQRSEHS